MADSGPIQNINVNVEAETVTVQTASGTTDYPLASAEAFDAISRVWLRCGWDVKHVYSFTWMGRPIIQLPEDMIRLQEVIHRVKPDVIVETGIAHGGGAIYYASLCQAMGRGRVVAVDIEIRPHNRQAIEAHPLYARITLIEGDSTATDVVAQVRSHIKPDDTVMVMLDSCHTRAHVLKELRVYGDMVSAGSYIVVMDGIMQDLAGAPRSDPDWATNNPVEAAREFVAERDDFSIDTPTFEFNEGMVRNAVTYWPHAYLKRRSPSEEIRP